MLHEPYTEYRRLSTIQFHTIINYINIQHQQKMYEKSALIRQCCPEVRWILKKHFCLAASQKLAIVTTISAPIFYLGDFFIS